MCLSIPGKIKSIRNKIFTIDYGSEKREISKSLVRVKKGDCVLVQNRTIVRKIPAKQAKEALSLLG